MRFGTAVGSDDEYLIPFLKGLGELDFVELYTKPDVTVKQLLAWKESGLVGHMQAAHNAESGIDWDGIGVTSLASKVFDGELFIVYDAGYDMGEVETAFDDFDMTIPENMPYKTVFGETVFNMPEDVSADLESSFCLDLSHVWITAVQKDLDPRVLIRRFVDKKPCHFHLTDTDGINDHLPMGEGDIALEYIFSVLPEDATVTVESENEVEDREELIRKDLEYVQEKYESWSNNTSKSRL